MSILNTDTSYVYKIKLAEFKNTKKSILDNNNVFYGIVSNTGSFIKLIDTNVSSDRQIRIMLNVAPSSATFYNDKVVAHQVLQLCKKLHPDNLFKIRKFEY